MAWEKFSDRLDPERTSPATTGNDGTLVSFGYFTVRGNAGATRYFLRCRRSGVFAGCNFHCAGVATPANSSTRRPRKTNAPDQTSAYLQDHANHPPGRNHGLEAASQTLIEH